MKLLLIDYGSATLPFDAEFYERIRCNGADIELICSATKYNMEYLKGLTYREFHFSRTRANLFQIVMSTVMLSWFLLIKSRKYDKIILSWPRLILPELILALFWTKKLYYLKHNFQPHDGKKKKFAEKIIDKFVKKVIYISDGELGKDTRSGYSKYLVYHPIFKNDKRAEQISNTASLVLLGNVKKYKGVEKFIDLIEQQSSSKINLKIIGQGARARTASCIQVIDKFLDQREFEDTILDPENIMLLCHEGSSQSGLVYMYLGMKKPFIFNSEILRAHPFLSSIRELCFDSSTDIQQVINTYIKNFDHIQEKINSIVTEHEKKLNKQIYDFLY